MMDHAEMFGLVPGRRYEVTLWDGVEMRARNFLRLVIDVHGQPLALVMDGATIPWSSVLCVVEKP